MIKKIFLTYIKKIILIYFFIFPGKFKFKFLNNLNFKIIDFNSYEKSKNLIFSNNFYKAEKNPIIYNYDFINLPYSYEDKYKKLLMPKNCKNKL